MFQRKGTNKWTMQRDDRVPLYKRPQFLTRITIPNLLRLHFMAGVSNSNSSEGHFYRKKCSTGRKLRKKWLSRPQLLSKIAKIPCFAIYFFNFDSNAGRMNSLRGPRVWEPCFMVWSIAKQHLRIGLTLSLSPLPPTYPLFPSKYVNYFTFILILLNLLLFLFYTIKIE